MVRNPKTSTIKDATSLTPLCAQRELANYLNSVGQGGLSLTGGIPMMQEYYTSMIRNAKELIGKKQFRDIKLEGGIYYLSKNMNEKYRPVSDDARVSYYRAFGILPDMQIEMEKVYRNIQIYWCNKQCREHNVRQFFTTST
jgi:hypothetical protein